MHLFPTQGLGHFTSETQVATEISTIEEAKGQYSRGFESYLGRTRRADA